MCIKVKVINDHNTDQIVKLFNKIDTSGSLRPDDWQKVYFNIIFQTTLATDFDIKISFL